MRIGVVGAGAIGCAMTARLAAAGHDVALVVRDAARRAIIQEEGLSCVEEHETMRAAPRAVATLPEEPLDILFIVVKAGDIPAAVSALPDAAVTADTLVVPLVNGIPWWLRLGGADAGAPIRAVDPEGVLLHRFAAEQLVGSVVYTTAMATGPAAVQVMRRQTLVVGEVVEGVNARHVAMLAALSCNAGIATTVSDHIRDDLWTKVALNLATNPLSVVSGAGLGTLCSDPGLLPIVSTIVDETWRLASLHGATPKIVRAEMFDRGRAAGAFRTSMLEDYRNGRPLELGAIADAVFELAAASDIDMPVARTIADLARFLAADRPKEISR